MTALSRDQMRLSPMVLRHRPESAGLALDPYGWVLTSMVSPSYLTLDA